MVDRPSTATMRRQMYVPEERPDYQAYISDPENQRKAEEAAMGILGLAMGPFGEIPAGLRLARNVLGGVRLANKGEQLLPRPDRGNAMLPEEMLQVEGPPARQALPAPSRPPMSEEELQAMEIARMVGEGGPSFSKQEAARRATRRMQSEDERQANEMSRMMDEGGLDPETAALLRSIREERQRAQEAEDVSRFEGEGGGAWTYTGPRYKYGLPATQGFREVMPYSPGARDIIPYGSKDTLPTFAGGAGGMDFLSPSYRFAEGQRTLPPGASAAPPGASVPPAGSKAFDISGKTPYGGEIVNAILGQPLGPPARMAGYQTGTLNLFNRPSAAPSAASTETIERRSPWDETNIAAPQFQPERRSPFDETNIAAPQFARATGSAARDTTPAPAPAKPQSTGADIRQLWENYNKSGSAADFVRADRAMQEAKKAGVDLGLPTAQGEKRGGAVNGKDAAVHKALEIIHHLVTR